MQGRGRSPSLRKPWLMWMTQTTCISGGGWMHRQCPMAHTPSRRSRVLTQNHSPTATDIDDVVGTATYKGAAAGMYVTKDVDCGSSYRCHSRRVHRKRYAACELRGRYCGREHRRIDPRLHERRRRSDGRLGRDTEEFDPCCWLIYLLGRYHGDDRPGDDRSRELDWHVLWSQRGGRHRKTSANRCSGSV